MKALKVTLIVLGMALMIGGVIATIPQSSTSAGSNNTAWTCEQPPDPDSTPHVVMRCEHIGGPGVLDSAFPVTLSLIGLGFVVAASSIRSAAPQPGQPLHA